MYVHLDKMPPWMVRSWLIGNGVMEYELSPSPRGGTNLDTDDDEALAELSNINASLLHEVRESADGILAGAEERAKVWELWREKLGASAALDMVMGRVPMDSENPSKVLK